MSNNQYVVGNENCEYVDSYNGYWCPSESSDDFEFYWSTMMFEIVGEDDVNKWFSFEV